MSSNQKRLKPKIKSEKEFLSINGKVCMICCEVIQSANQEGVIQCSGFCKEIMHEECALKSDLIRDTKTEEEEKSSDKQEENEMQSVKTRSRTFKCTLCSHPYA